MLSNSLGSSLLMWDKVLAPLESTYRILRYDMRGHGASSTPPGPYSLNQLGEDLLHLLDEIGTERMSFCGLSLGGLVGMWLAAYAPHRLSRLILANTAPRIGNPEMWDERIAFVRQSGMEPLAVANLARWFTAQYREMHGGELKQIERMIASTSTDGYCGCCAVLRVADLWPKVFSIKVPSLVIAGTHDPATPPTDGRALAAALHGAQYAELDASHLSAWEKPHEFADAVLTFLTQGEQSNG